MKVLVVDDEPVARQVLREQLEEIADIEIAGEAATGSAAIEQIGIHQPDVLFMDLQMPEMDGFAVVRALRGERLPLVIFVTAYREPAASAFEVGAVDYLLKPVRQERLAAAVEKARAQLGSASAKPAAPPPSMRRIVGRIGADLYMLDPAEVVAFQAEGDIVFILTAQRRYLSGYSLRTLEEKLDRRQFRRVHRKTIINTDHIRKISPLSSKRWLLKMSNGMEAIVSKRLTSVIREETAW